MRVYKYPFEMGDWVSIRMPEGAQPLHVNVQHGQPCLWALVPVGAPPVEHRFRIAGTGHDLGNVGEYVGTFHMHEGSLVFHMFQDAAP